MYIQRNISKRKSGKVYKSVLLCHKYREDGKIKTKVLTNLSMLPDEAVLSLENSLKKKTEGTMVLSEDIGVEKVIDYGYVFIILWFLEKLRISELFDKLLPKYSGIIKLIIVGKIMTKGSKLAIFNWVQRNTFLAQKLGVNLKTLKLEDIYQALEVASSFQSKIEHKWNLYNKTRLKEVFLYDITSSYFEGNQNQLAAFGYSRDAKKNKMQVTIGLITDSNGFPLKIEVFKDFLRMSKKQCHKTVLKQLKDIRENLGAERIIFVGDRGMKIRYNIEQLAESERSKIDYITGLTKDEIKGLVKKEVIQLNMFSKDLAEVSDAEERFILSVNPDLAQKSTHIRTQLRNKFEDEISELKQKWQKRKEQNIANKQKIENGHKNKKLVTEFNSKQIDSYKKRAFEHLKNYKMSSYYSIKIDQKNFVIDFNLTAYNNDKKLDGFYVIATNIKSEKLNTKQVREHYKLLQHVEHAFRDLKTVQLEIRPIFHVKEAQTRGHVLLTMFSYSIIQAIENSIFPLLKEINQKEKEKLSYNDLKDELSEIKIVEISIGRTNKKIEITKLTQRQKTIFKALNIKENELIKKAL